VKLPLTKRSSLHFANSLENIILTKAAHENKFKEVNEAYDTLKNTTEETGV
jgi:curved DNA-binding protein CbpA